MDNLNMLPPAWSQMCVCGRTFSVPRAYSCHLRACQKTKKRLIGAIEKAREKWTARKRQRTDVPTVEQAAMVTDEVDAIAVPNVDKNTEVLVLSFHPRFCLAEYLSTRSPRLKFKTWTDPLQCEKLNERIADCQSAMRMFHLNLLRLSLPFSSPRRTLLQMQARSRTHICHQPRQVLYPPS